MQVSEFKKWLMNAHDKYLSSKSLMRASKDDPPQEPYRSKYEAKEILLCLLHDLEKQYEEDDFRISVIKATVKYELGVIDLETEEYSSGCDYLTDSWEALKNISVKPECCILAINVLNQLGILWSGRGEPSKAEAFLKQAENVYESYKNSNETCPYQVEDIFEFKIIPKEDWAPFEKVHTLTLYYLAQVYEHLNNSEKSAKYCHMTLRRQRESGEYEEKEWSVNCATLSQYYIQEKMYLVGRHLLACSFWTLIKYEASIDNRVDNEDVWDDIHRSKAEVAWCWLKYCINLLLEYQNLCDHNNESKELDSMYKLSEEEEIRAIERKVPSSVSSFEDSRKIFLFGQDQIKEAKLYYTLSDHANNHVQLIQDHSKLYKCLIFYETDMGRQCKMHKRRLDMLENALSKLNPQYYLAVCRQLCFELGETYYELSDLKLKIKNTSAQSMVASPVKKVNFLIMQAINHFKGFINTLKDHQGVLPETFADDLVRPALIAHFYLGGLYMKIIESDTSKKLYNLSLSEENYKFILNYSENNPDHTNCIEKELPVVKEMIQLMPEQIMQVTGSTLF